MTQILDLHYTGSISEITTILDDTQNTMLGRPTFFNDLYQVIEDIALNDLHTARYYVKKYDNPYDDVDVEYIKQSIKDIESNLKLLKNVLYHEFKG